MRHQSRSQSRVAELAGRQHGVVSGRQLVGLGFSRQRIAREKAAGRLHSLHRDIYAVGHRAVSQQGLCIGAVLAAGDEALLSHRSAAWLWGLTKRWWLPLEVTAASRRQARGAMRLHSAESITSSDRAIFEGIPLTAVPRTLLDFARVDPRFLPTALDNAHRLGVLDLIAIDELISRSGGFRGVARLRSALEIHRPTPFTRSGLERRFLALVRRAGLPQPSTNFYIEGCELDAYWPGERFAVELDTYDYHGTPAAFEVDRIRQESLKLAGVEMIRITGTRLDREPSAVMGRLAQLLARRQAEFAKGDA